MLASNDRKAVERKKDWAVVMHVLVIQKEVLVEAHKVLNIYTTAITLQLAALLTWHLAEKRLV